MGSDYVFAGLAHVELANDAFDFGHGVFLRRTYAHLMAPQLMAFAPAPPGGHHPPPWRAAKGGRAFDINVELAVPTDSALPGGLSAEETIWLVAALMRLVRYPFLVVAVIADQPFSDAAHSETEPLLRPFEAEPRIMGEPEAHGRALNPIELDWVRRKWVSCAELMQNHAGFRTALRAFDSSTLQGRTSSSLLAVWGGLEQLFSPSPGELRFRASSYIAAYLERAGPRRLALYKSMLKLYGERSKAAHTADEANLASLVESYVVMRNALVRMVEEGQVPTQSDLERLLFCESTATAQESGG